MKYRKEVKSTTREKCFIDVKIHFISEPSDILWHQFKDEDLEQITQLSDEDYRGFHHKIIKTLHPSDLNAGIYNPPTGCIAWRKAA